MASKTIVSAIPPLVRKLAEEVGFEPTVELPRLISNQLP